MSWWQPILYTVIGGGLFFGGIWVGARISRGEPLVPEKPKPPPVPIYDSPADRNRIRAEARKAALEDGIAFQEMR